MQREGDALLVAFSTQVHGAHISGFRRGRLHVISALVALYWTPVRRVEVLTNSQKYNLKLCLHLPTSIFILHVGI